MIPNREDGLSLSRACSALDVSRDGFLKWQKRSPKQIEPKLVLDLHDIKADFPLYGYRRATHELKRRGYNINHKKVLGLMQKEHLTVVKSKFKPKTTQSNHKLKRYPNLAKDFMPTAINQIVVSDITYIYLKYGFVYLAVIMDIYSRRIIGWELSRDVDTQLTLNALNMAVALRGKANVNSCIHHSDHGVQYLSNLYIERLKRLGMKPSMGEVGNSYDNAFAESLIKTIKYEEVYMNEYETFEEAYENIERFIKDVYNKKRLHSKIGYRPPIEFEKIGGLK